MGDGSGYQFVVACQQVSFLGGGDPEQCVVVDALIEQGIETKYTQVSGESAQIIIADEPHLRNLKAAEAMVKPPVLCLRIVFA
jgi:hypothetical protein